MRPVVVEAWQYAARCGGCEHRTKGAYPEGLEPTRRFGPQIEAVLGYFRERHHVGYERLVEVCRDLFGLRISEGAIDPALRRLAERARPTYDASEQDLRPSVIHRKVTGGFRSQLGADLSAIFTSLLTTARKRGENLIHALRSVAGPSPLHAAGMPT